MVSVINVLYVVLDIVIIALGLLVAFHWGRTGLLAKTLWLLVMGIICYSVGDVLWLISDEAGGMGVVQAIAEGTIWEFQLADVSYLIAVILWLVAFLLPVKHILSQPRREQLFGKSAEVKVENGATAGTDVKAGTEAKADQKVEERKE